MHDRKPSVIDVLRCAEAHMIQLLVNIHEQTSIATV